MRNSVRRRGRERKSLEVGDRKKSWEVGGKKRENIGKWVGEIKKSIVIVIIWLFFR